MNTLEYAIKTLVAAGVIATLAAAPSFALIAECVGEDTDYPNLSTTKSDEFPIRCVTAKDDETGEMVTLYGKTTSDCAQSGVVANDQQQCKTAADETEGVATEDESDEEEPEESDTVDETEATGETSNMPTHTEDVKKNDDHILMIVLFSLSTLIVVLITVSFVMAAKRKKGEKAPTVADAQNIAETPAEPAEAVKPEDPTDTPAAA